MTDSADPIARLGEIVGPVGALTRCARWGGTRLFVPRARRDDHRIAAWIGGGAMARLCQVYGGDTLGRATHRPRSTYPPPGLPP